MHSHDLTRWLFALTDERAATGKGFDDSRWRAVTVPHDWSVELDFAQECSSGTGYLPGGVAWYRAHVSIAELRLVEDGVVRLVFEGVYKNADVWVNGYHLGGRPSGYARFSFDLTEILGYAPDDDLVVAVRVAHTDLSDSRWYNGAGITRAVRLQMHQPVHVREHGTVVTTESATAEHAVVRVRQHLGSTLEADTAVRVRHELRSLTSDRTPGVETDVVVPATGTADLDVTIDVDSPDLWSDTAPHLYRLTTTLSWDGGQESEVLVVGIRTFRFDPDTGFHVNGEPRVLKGVCLHEDAGCLGNAVPAQVWLRRLLRLQEMGCNAVRMAHNPHAPELYALCDALGLYVIDEAFDEWDNPKNKWWQGHNVYPPRHDGPAEHFPEWSERDLVAMIEAHRHHPSVIAWSIGNEIDYPNDPYASPLFDEMTGNNDAHKPQAERLYDPDRPDARRLTTIARRLGAIVRRTDPTRPVTLAAAFPELSSRTGLLDDLDLVGYNYKEHLYAADHRRFPDKPFLGSENSHRYGDWRQVTDHDYVAGQFLWTGIDYLGEARGWPIHGSGAGLLTLAGFEKHTWHLRRSWWSETPSARLVTRPPVTDGAEPNFWTHPVGRDWEPGADAVEVLCFAHGGEPVLMCGTEQIPLVRDSEHGYWSALAGSSAEPLVLEVRSGGAVVARDELRSRGEPAELVAAVWQPPAGMAALAESVGLDLGAVVQVEVTLLDASGRPARGERLVTAHVADGELLGLENGDLADNTPYREPSRSTLDGRLLVHVRAGEGAVLTLSGADLAPVTLRCSM